MGFASFFSRQARNPAGWFGRWVMAGIFDMGNARLNRLVYDMMSPQADDHILEIGFGTGRLLGKIAGLTDGCMVEGIDFSDTMVSMAKRKNRKYIAQGKVVLHEGNVDDKPFPPETFTKIFSVNTLYFWPDPDATARKIFQILKPGGRLILGYEDIVQLENRRLDTNVFRFFTVSELEALLRDAGFTGSVSTRSMTRGSLIFHGTAAFK